MIAGWTAPTTAVSAVTQLDLRSLAETPCAARLSRPVPGEDRHHRARPPAPARSAGCAGQPSRARVALATINAAAARPSRFQSPVTTPIERDISKPGHHPDGARHQNRGRRYGRSDHQQCAGNAGEQHHPQRQARLTLGVRGSQPTLDDEGVEQLGDVDADGERQRQKTLRVDGRDTRVDGDEHRRKDIQCEAGDDLNGGVQMLAVRCGRIGCGGGQSSRRAESVCVTTLAILARKISGENCSACCRIFAGSNVSAVEGSERLREVADHLAHRRSPLTKVPVTPSTTLSSAPPTPRAITGVPHAMASTGVMPKSSSPGMTIALARRYRLRNSSSDTRPRNVMSAPAASFLHLAASRPSPATTSSHAGLDRGSDGDVGTLVPHQPPRQQEVVLTWLSRRAVCRSRRSQEGERPANHGSSCS